MATSIVRSVLTLSESIVVFIVICRYRDIVGCLMPCAASLDESAGVLFAKAMARPGDSAVAARHILNSAPHVLCIYSCKDEHAGCTAALLFRFASRGRNQTWLSLFMKPEPIRFSYSARNLGGE